LTPIGAKPILIIGPAHSTVTSGYRTLEISDDVLDALAGVSTETVIEAEGSRENRKSRPIRKTKVKLHDKIRALHLLGEHVGPSKLRKGDTAHPFADMVNQLLRANHKHRKTPIRRDSAE
jgi:hypothetical protein